ncbi:hypothetical protein AgCh_012447 [Apium graveolens]
MFRSKFDSWPQSTEVTVSEDGRGKAAALLKCQRLNVKGLLKATPAKEEPQPYIDCTGNLQVWRVDGDAKTPLIDSNLSKFYSGDCNIFQYTYLGESGEEYLVGTWFGNQSVKEDRNSATSQASQMAESLKFLPVQVTEIHNFDQDDLMTEDIYILDYHSDIIFWVGQQTMDKQTSLEDLRILLAEDTPVLQRVATIILEKLGAKVVAVGDGMQVVNALHFQPKPESYEDECFQADDKPCNLTEESDFPVYDLILMDCQMPKMDGYEATKAIRGSEIGSTLHIPIVALTAHAMSSDEAKCLEVHGCITNKTD